MLEGAKHNVVHPSAGAFVPRVALHFHDPWRPRASLPPSRKCATSTLLHSYFSHTHTHISGLSGNELEVEGVKLCNVWVSLYCVRTDEQQYSPSTNRDFWHIMRTWNDFMEQMWRSCVRLGLYREGLRWWIFKIGWVNSLLATLQKRLTHCRKLKNSFEPDK